MTNIPTKPDYIVKAMDKETGIKSPRLGAAWINRGKVISISIIMDAGCAITHDKSITFSLFPNDR